MSIAPAAWQGACVMVHAGCMPDWPRCGCMQGAGEGGDAGHGHVGVHGSGAVHHWHSECSTTDCVQLACQQRL